MAFNGNITIPAKTWVLLTSNDITAFRIQAVGVFPIYIHAAVGEVVPASRDGAIVVSPNLVISADMTLANLFPHAAGANRVYGYCENLGVASVSHD
jgi:hypothetical protein